MVEKVNGIIANEAVRTISGYSEDEIAQKAAFKRERAIADYNNRYDDGKIDGIAEGIADERKRNILQLNKYGLKMSEIASALDLSAEEVQNILDNHNKEHNDG